MGTYVSAYSKHGDINKYIADNHPNRRGFIEYRKKWLFNGVVL